MSLKHYSCNSCGYDKEIDTNHFGQCYSLGDYNMCPNCGAQPTVWECKADIPPGTVIPPDWKLIKFEDIIDEKD